MEKGWIVLATAGREKGKLFAVLSVTEGFALIADGKSRRVEKPKRKKMKHLRPAGEILPPDLEAELGEYSLRNKPLHSFLVKVSSEKSFGIIL